MYYELYLDVLFILNLVMNYFLLRLVNRLLLCSARHRKSILAGSISAGLLCLYLWIGKSEIRYLPFVSFVVNTGMVKYGCEIKKLKELGKGIVLLYGAAFLMGGFFFWIEKYISLSQGKHFIVVAGIIFFLANREIAFYQKERNVQTYEWDFLLCFDGKKVNGKAFVDSGNFLQDRNTPVNFIAGTTFQELVGEEFSKIDACFFVKEKYSRYKPHYLPVAGAGGMKGVVLVMHVDWLQLENKKEIKKVYFPEVAIAFDSPMFGKEYQLILHPKLMKR